MEAIFAMEDSRAGFLALASAGGTATMPTKPPMNTPMARMEPAQRAERGFCLGGTPRVYATLALAAAALFGGDMELRAAPTEGKMFIGNPVDGGVYSEMAVDVQRPKPAYKGEPNVSYPVNTNKPLLEPRGFIDVGVSAPPKPGAQGRNSIPGQYPVGQGSANLDINGNGTGFVKVPDWSNGNDAAIDMNLRAVNIEPIRKPGYSVTIGVPSASGTSVPVRTITGSWAGYKRPAGVTEDLPRYGSMPQPRQRVHYVSPIKLTAADMNTMSGNTNKGSSTVSYVAGWQRPRYRATTFADDGFTASPAPASSPTSARKLVSTGAGPIDPTALGVLSTDTGGVTSYKSKTAASGLSLSGVPPSGLASPAPSGYTTTTGSATSPNALTAASIPSGYNSTLTLSGDSTVTVTVEPTIALAAAQPDPAALGNSAPKTTALMSSGGATTQNYGTLNDGVVDINWRLASDYSNVSYLKDKTTLSSTVTGSAYWENPYGAVNFEALPIFRTSGG